MSFFPSKEATKRRKKNHQALFNFILFGSYSTFVQATKCLSFFCVYSLHCTPSVFFFYFFLYREPIIKPVWNSSLARLLHCMHFSFSIFFVLLETLPYFNSILYSILSLCLCIRRRLPCLRIVLWFSVVVKYCSIWPVQAFTACYNI